MLSTLTYLSVASADFSALLFFLLSSVADDDTLRFFLSLFFFLAFLSSGSLSELELLEEDEESLVLVADELLSDSELELDELLDGVRFFRFPAAEYRNVK